MRGTFWSLFEQLVPARDVPNDPYRLFFGACGPVFPACGLAQRGHTVLGHAKRGALFGTSVASEFHVYVASRSEATVSNTRRGEHRTGTCEAPSKARELA